MPNPIESARELDISLEAALEDITRHQNDISRLESDRLEHQRAIERFDHTRKTRINAFLGSLVDADPLYAAAFEIAWLRDKNKIPSEGSTYYVEHMAGRIRRANELGTYVLQFSSLLDTVTEPQPALALSVRNSRIPSQELHCFNADFYVIKPGLQLTIDYRRRFDPQAGFTATAQSIFCALTRTQAVSSGTQQFDGEIWFGPPKVETNPRDVVLKIASSHTIQQSVSDIILPNGTELIFGQEVQTQLVIGASNIRNCFVGMREDERFFDKAGLNELQKVVDAIK